MLQSFTVIIALCTFFVSKVDNTIDVLQLGGSMAG